MNRFMALVALVGFVVAGCDKQQDAKAAVPESQEKAVVTNSSENVVMPKTPEVAVRIDGKDLTRTDILRNGKVVLLLNMNKARKTKVGAREARATERYCRSAVYREISKTAVSLYLKEKGLAPSTNDIKRATRRFERQYGAKSRKLKRWHNVGDLKYMLGKNAFRADEMIAETANYDVMTNNLIKANAKALEITDDMVNARLENIRKANLRAIATNNCVFAQATNVWRKIIAKELTFEDAAKKFSEDEYIAEGCDWGCFTREQLDGDPQVVALLPTLKTGDVTAPVESDGGVAILRKEEDDNDKTYSFSRVFFRLAYIFEDQKPQEIRKELSEEKTKQLIQDTIKAYREKLKIEYPNGTNFIWKLKPQDCI